MGDRKRESTGFLIKQRAFIKMYLITNIENGKWYGMQLLDEMKKEFKPFGFEPQHSEIYRALHDLLEEGVLTRGKSLRKDRNTKRWLFIPLKIQRKRRPIKKWLKLIWIDQLSYLEKP